VKNELNTHLVNQPHPDVKIQEKEQNGVKRNEIFFIFINIINNKLWYLHN